MQVAPTPEPLKETVLPDAVPRGLLDELRHFPHEDAGLGDLDGFGEDHLGPHLLHLLLQREAGFMGEAALFLFVGPCTGGLHGIHEVGERGDAIYSGLANGRNDLMYDPAFERLGLRLAGPEDERVQARF